MRNLPDAAARPGDQEPGPAPLPEFTRAGVLTIAALLAVLLAAFAGRYGYHRDELYFIACGQHLAWGYPDQPPPVPAVARLMSAIAPDSVVVLRLPAVAAAVALVMLAGLLARELHGGRVAQLLAAAALAVSALALATGHLLSTTTFDLPASALLFWLILRILRTGQSRLWLAVGVIAGLGLLDTDLVAFLMFSIVAGLLIAGPGPAARRSGHRGGCGVRRSQLSRISGSLRLAARLNNHLNVPDDEQGAPVWVCSDLRMSWAAAWPGLRYLG